MLTDYFWARHATSDARTSVFNRLRRRFLYLTPRYLRYLSQTVVLTPWAMGLVSLCLFAFVPQMKEIYISLIEDRALLQGMLGLAALSAFSALLYFLNHTMVTRRIDGIYPDHADIFFDRGVIGIRNLKTMIVSALPFAGLSIGLLNARSQVLSEASHVTAVIKALGGGLDQAEALQAELQTLPGNITLCIGVAVALCLGLILALYRSRNDQRWQRRFLFACYALTVLAVAAPVLFSNTTMAVSRAAGPLASTGLVLIAGAITLRILVWIAAEIVWVLLTLPSIVLLSLRRMPLAVRQLIAVFVPMLAIVLIGANLVPFAVKDEVQRVSIFKALEELNKNSNKDRARLNETFANWLKARETGTAEYPVFIVTAEGGGIYAASAISFFLAQMEERCPAFAEHIFAISGVSGGSVGASLFDAALAEKVKGKDVSRAGGTAAGCREPAAPGELLERMRRITRDDHLSPVLAYILPDLVRDIRELFVGASLPKEPCKNEARFEWFGRDQILEKSFIWSFAQSRTQDRSLTTVCPDAASNNLLMRNFKDIWSEREKLPALLLNATWVETGYRVAFSPFPLQHLGEGTLLIRRCGRPPAGSGAELAKPVFDRSRGR